MTKKAFLFAGQGAQFLGMGRDLYDQFDLVKETFDQASKVLGYDVRELIDQDEEKLNLTRYTQPAILTTSISIYRLLESNGIKADMMAGLSLGEYSALVAAGYLDFEEALALVAKRGAYMEEAAPAGSGKMVAVLNAPIETIEKACKEASSLGVVSPANYNTPAQIVIGGEGAAVDQAVELLTEAGVKRMIPLNVSGPFHTALLEPASQRLAQALEEVAVQDGQTTVVGNTLAQVVQKEEIKSLLTRQVMEPVRFYESIETMKEAGVTEFIEIGPGKVLSGFIKKIDKAAGLAQVDDLSSLEALLEN